jgi:hypothetical protein
LVGKTAWEGESEVIFPKKQGKIEMIALIVLVVDRFLKNAALQNMGQ